MVHMLQPQAAVLLGHLGFREVDVFRGILIKQKSSAVIKASRLLFVQLCINAHNYNQLTNLVFI